MVRVLNIFRKITDYITVEDWLVSEPEIKGGLAKTG